MDHDDLLVIQVPSTVLNPTRDRRPRASDDAEIRDRPKHLRLESTRSEASRARNRALLVVSRPEVIDRPNGLRGYKPTLRETAVSAAFRILGTEWQHRVVRTPSRLDESGGTLDAAIGMEFAEKVDAVNLLGVLGGLAP
jgi:hypothetical protein